MREVKVKKSELLEKVKANREKHIKAYTEACAGYRDQALAKIDEIFGDLKAKIHGLKAGQTIEMMAVQFGLNCPRSYEKSYDQTITMLEMEVNEIITLSNSEFACFVMDDWDWKDEFNSTYGMNTQKRR